MKYAVISDVHGNLEALRAVIKDIGDSADQLLCLGDVVGYYPDPGECIDILKSHGAVCVLGNHDSAVIGGLELDWFNPDARQAIEWTRSRLTASQMEWLRGLPGEVTLEGKLLCVHGAPGSLSEYILDAGDAERALGHLARHYADIEVCLYGHTHMPAVWRHGEGKAACPAALAEGERYLVNPGSVGQPRGGKPGAHYLLLDALDLSIEWRCVNYDLAVTQAKVYRAGLPPYLAERLAYGE